MTVGELLGVGGVLIAIGSMVERLRSLQASNRGQGERIGRLEKFMAGVQERKRLMGELGIIDHQVPSKAVEEYEEQPRPTVGALPRRSMGEPPPRPK